MPLTTTQLAAHRATHTFPYAGDTVTIVYQPGKITKQKFAELQTKLDESSEEDMDAVDVFAEAICDFAISWDVLEPDGKTMFPLEPARVATLDIPFLRRVIRELTQGELKGTSSKTRSTNFSAKDRVSG